jgi:hypothetical protein
MNFMEIVSFILSLLLLFCLFFKYFMVLGSEAWDPGLQCGLFSTHQIRAIATQIPPSVIRWRLERRSSGERVRPKATKSIVRVAIKYQSTHFFVRNLALSDISLIVFLVFLL